MSNSGGKKRHYGGGGRRQQNPPRGAPGILFTCEVARESRCKHEGLEILQHDWEQHNQHASIVDSKSSAEQQHQQQDEEKTLSLDEELAALKAGNNNKKDSSSRPFAVFETGCKGTVFVLCRACQPIVTLLPSDEKADDDDDDEDEDKCDEPLEKKAKTDDELKAGVAKEKESSEAADPSTSTITTTTLLPLWNPLQAVERVVSDIEKGTKEYPGSRFITRMIPIQATCFAKLTAIQHVVAALLEPVVLATEHNKPAGTSSSSKATPSSKATTATTTTTFAIQTKRRLCEQLMTREEIIDAVATTVGKCAPTWKVNLTKPDYTIIVEVCKTIAGVSVVPSTSTTTTAIRNFNLATLREKMATNALSDNET